MKKIHVQLVKKSNNPKTGEMPVSTTSMEHCPIDCPFYTKGCYAKASLYQRLNWEKVTIGERGTGWNTFCDSIESLPTGTLWRHNQAGDLPGDRITIHAPSLRKLVKANSGKRGFTYTHYNVESPENAKAVREANSGGFTVNLSGNNLKHADRLKSIDCGPVVSVVPSEWGRKTKGMERIRARMESARPKFDTIENHRRPSHPDLSRHNRGYKLQSMWIMRKKHSGINYLFSRAWHGQENSRQDKRLMKKGPFANREGAF